ncbi:hypothetical protein F7725_020062 [Dissostichus mawsoni]|uniref:Uncharacterized protein n=1 Tax=Dissostichus mawsoni TaxID=36200 RepID=A0A7J5YMH0_DISMA|nr:hypothetical protein F7725_020062 [Dissostichus mawsoni]
MWSYEGWKDPHITVIFFCCVFIGCLMNFTTLHCTYINSAVTTSFVGVVKSIATITTEVVQDGVANGDVGNGETEANPHVMTETEMLEMQREHLHKENAAPNPGPSVSDSYLGVWRSIRHLQFMKKEPLIDNMEQQSP